MVLNIFTKSVLVSYLMLIRGVDIQRFKLHFLEIVDNKVLVKEDFAIAIEGKEKKSKDMDDLMIEQKN